MTARLPGWRSVARVLVVTGAAVDSIYVVRVSGVLREAPFPRLGGVQVFVAALLLVAAGVWLVPDRPTTTRERALSLIYLVVSAYVLIETARYVHDAANVVNLF